MIKTNYHTHHELCGHAGGKTEDYVLEAIKNGYKEIGMSDHGPLPNEPFPRMSLDDFNNIYLKEIEIAKEKYQNVIKIKSGIEIEYVSNNIEYYKMLHDKLDYMILGCHYYSNEDGYKDKSAYRITTHERLDEYTKMIEEALDTKLFTILAHPDLFLIGYPKFDFYAVECSKRIIQSAIKNDVIIEYNANGLRRGKKTFEDGSIDYAYPNSKFWFIVKELNPKVIIGSDCHTPEVLEDECMEEARKKLKELRIKYLEKLED